MQIVLVGMWKRKILNCVFLVFCISSLLLCWTIYRSGICIPDVVSGGLMNKQGRGVPDVVDSRNYCTTVHVAFVVAGSGAVRDVTVVLKSMMFHRHASLHFHFISDSIARHSLGVLMHTWNLPFVNYSFYPVETIAPNVSWIPNAHYSGIFGLMKLTLPTVLLTIDRVIVLDIDIIITADIYNLWRLFAIIAEKGKLIGLVENQSDWYLGTIWKNHIPWPALGRGFNTGVMLMDLEAMRRNDWSNLWRETAKLTLPDHKYTSLADQDIINTVIKYHPHIVWRLSCEWNIQLSDHSRSSECYFNTTNYNIIHWNSPKKLSTGHKHSLFFREIHNMFDNFDGTRLRNSLVYCQRAAIALGNDKLIKSEQSTVNLCNDDFSKRGQPFRTHIYYYESVVNSSDPLEVCLVSQLSMDRLQTLEIILHHWVGPISLALYATDAETIEFTEYINSLSIAKNKWNFVVHVVYKEKGRLYPVNYLRNVALNASNSPFVFLSDIDFVPMYKLYTYLREAIKVMKPHEKKRALIVPAFESLHYNLAYPNDKYTLLSAIDRGKVAPFRQDIWEQGHSATNYQLWYTADRPYKIDWTTNYEPYVVVARNVTRFDERFTGFGWNKVSHIMQLDAEGYQFIVLPDAFTIHYPHAPSVDISHFRANSHYRECQKELKQRFIKELIEKYGPEADKYLL